MIGAYACLWEEITLQIDIHIWEVLIEVLLELSVRDFVAVLKLAVLFTLFLNGIVRKVNHAVSQVRK